ncbi:unnamed protein product, partial [Polarella glacialis]
SESPCDVMSSPAARRRMRFSTSTVLLSTLAVTALAWTLLASCFVPASISGPLPASAAGASLSQGRRSPSVLRHARGGGPLTLSEENVESVLQDARYNHIPQCFGYVEESTASGITGKVDLFELE